MIDTWYQWWYFDEQELKTAKQQVMFLQGRIDTINNNTKFTDKEKQVRTDRINLSLNAVKHLYGL